MMKMIRALLGAAALLAAFAPAIATAQEKDGKVYELRTYTTLPGRLPALHRRFADHTIRLFARHGIKSVAYWTPTDEAHQDNTLIYILQHESREAADRNWKAFQADPEWVKAREASEADGKILAKPPERVFMRLTGYSPLQ
ncbi:MAG TPA: NIPSNAP family protein [Burkholderiales bacterium]|nr:NIPSNAP family protein [Burkholderiales bacterium]